ncbi:hypothetical protein GZ78_15295 [Endozoicomonas numazuensis]|uniref:Uncharacterized protein n=2 Tax=Endozoicomonas numazuensis TaxID=1137799 RepID=A0A081NFH9_9GAMM|nr:hypothetical protein GZ78_15295 [Endozoicomonas numazuensis]
MCGHPKEKAKYIYFFIFFLFSTSATCTPLDFLVSFSPAIQLQEGDFCQGVRVSKGYIASSPSCIKEIKNKLSSTVVGVIDHNQSHIDEVIETTEINYIASDVLLAITNDQEHSYFYPTHHTVGELIDYSFYYSFNENGISSQNYIELSLPNNNYDSPIYTLTSELTLQQGTPIFDQNSKLICLVASNALCKPVSYGVTRIKRNSVGDDDDNTIYYSVVAGVTVAVAVAAIIATQGIVLSILYCRANSRGMPCNVFWSGILGCKYCAEPYTKYCFTGGWPTMAWHWIGDYNRADTSSQPDYQAINTDP